MGDAAPIFVVGSGRSGTSLLRAMLNAHPAIHLSQEAALYRWSAPDRVPGCTTARAWFDAYSRTASFRFLRLDPGPIRATIQPALPRSQLAPVFQAILSAKADRFGRRRWGDKTPLQALNLKRIFADFPDARVLHVTRHPVPTAASLARMPWGSDSWIANALLLRAVATATQPYADRILELRLEDLIADPRAVLGRTLAFVGEPWDDAVLDHARRADFADDPPLPWLQTAAEPVGAPRTARVDLSPESVAGIERLARPALARFGYAPWPVDRAPRSLKYTAAILGDLGRALRLLSALLSAPNTRLPARLDAEAQLRWLLTLNPSVASTPLPALPPIWLG